MNTKKDLNKHIIEVVDVSKEFGGVTVVENIHRAINFVK